MKKISRSAGLVIKLFLYFSAFITTSCTVGSIYYGAYYADGQQKINLSADSTFTFVTPGLKGEPSSLSGTWTRKENKLLLRPQKTDTRKLEPTVAIEAGGVAKDRLVINSELGVSVFVEVLLDGAKVGELSKTDSSFVYEGKPGQLVFRAYTGGLYADLFKKDTLYSEPIRFSDNTQPFMATVRLSVSLRDFHRTPVEDAYLQIKSRQKIFWDKRNALFYWEEPEA